MKFWEATRERAEVEGVRERILDDGHVVASSSYARGARLKD